MAGSVGGGKSLISMGLSLLPSSISSCVRFVGDDGGVKWMGEPRGEMVRKGISRAVASCSLIRSILLLSSLCWAFISIDWFQAVVVILVISVVTP